MLHLDGSRFSGSGTVVRFGVPLAALTGQALHLTNVPPLRQRLWLCRSIYSGV